MASIGNARPYIEPVVAAAAAPPGTDGARFVAAFADGSGAALANDFVIAVEPTVHELTPVEVLQQARGYIALALLVVAVSVITKLGVMLWRRYRIDNVSPVTKQAADRRSLRRANKTLI